MTTTAEGGRAVVGSAEVEPTPVATIKQAIERMQDITKEAPPRDGLACFNHLYTEITVAVRDGLTNGDFDDPPFMTTLDVAFANRYFDALREWGAGRPDAVPRVWSALLEERANLAITPIQFAAAGVNAHINLDLAVALVQAVTTEGGSLDAVRHHDYLEINAIFKRKYEQLRDDLTSGLVDEFDEGAVAAIVNVVSHVVVTKARDKAWDRALRMMKFLEDGDQAGHDAIVADSDSGFALAAHLLLAEIRRKPPADRLGG